MEHIISVLSKGHISMWTDNILKCIYSQNQICSLSRVLDQVMDLNPENTGAANISPSLVMSVDPKV